MFYQLVLAVSSFLIVAFGQPAWNWWLSLLSASIGFALFWRMLVDFQRAQSRFWISALWFTAVQLVQLSWFVSHPYWYIYGVYIGISLVLGLQFGIIGLLINPAKIAQLSRLCVIAALWTIMEWSRLFFMSGFSLNPVGLALAGNVLSLQTASLGGVFALSFLVIITNLLALHAWLTNFKPANTLSWVIVAMIPYLYGGIHLLYHRNNMSSNEKFFDTILVQPAFPAEESLKFQNWEEWLAFVVKEWEQILKITLPHKNDQPVDLIALPEAVVPFGTYTFVYPYEIVRETFLRIYGEKSLDSLPPLEIPWAVSHATDKGVKWYVSNAFWAQGIANYFEAPIVAGLEDAEDIADGNREYYAAAVYFKPFSHSVDHAFQPSRYAKRILLPMGEYIPFDFVKSLAAQYGVVGSFTHGKNAVVWECNNVPFGISICYEETFGNLIRENRQLGASLLLNLTSDIWYPDSKLVRQHLEHARLRTVENGFALIRACNTGITCAIDSLGKDIAVLGSDDVERQRLSASIRAKVPLYHYHTPYTYYGDKAIIALCFCILPLYFRKYRC